MHDKARVAFASWEAFYQSDLQSVYALWVVPIAFLVARRFLRSRGAEGVEPRAAAFIDSYALLFTLETIVDPFATGPLLRWMRIEGTLATYCTLPFVLIGDFRVYLLIFFVIAPERGVATAVTRALAWTIFVVPLFAWATTRVLEAKLGALPPQTIWIAYELGFSGVALFLWARVVPTSVDIHRFEVLEYLLAIVRYVGWYYALWAIADLLIVVGHYDWGWALRVIPNQLYYSFWIAFAHRSFFSPRYVPTRRSTQIAR